MKRGRGNGADERRRVAFGQSAVTGWVSRLHGQAPRHVLLLGILLLVLVALADALSGPHYSFSIFYLFVVVRVSATGRRSYLLPTAALVAVTWTAVEALNRPLEEAWLPSLWNTGARLGVLYLSALLVAVVVGAARHEREASRTDPLTGLHNRRGFRDQAELEISRAERSQGGLSAVYLDIDGFKDVNDLQGHAAGDRLLTQVARSLSRTMRKYDLVARVGGDEFVALLPGTCGDEAMAVARRAADDLDEMCRRGGWPVRVSIGVSSFVTAPRDVDELLEAADVLMYGAKREGRQTGRSTVRGAVSAGA